MTYCFWIHNVSERLTRAERQDRTHEQLMAAGLAVFLRRGFLAATVEEVAADAGYTRGAVYKHFGGKEGLWQAIVDAHADTHLQRLRAALDQVTSRDELLAVLNPVGYVHEAAARWTASFRPGAAGTMNLIAG